MLKLLLQHVLDTRIYEEKDDFQSRAFMFRFPERKN